MNLEEKNDFSMEDIYFKDAFTQEGNDLNLEVDNINIDCMSSKNNKFSLDDEGNLTVNSITANLMTNGAVLADVTQTDSSATKIRIGDIQDLDDTGIYDFIAIVYTNGTATGDILLRINDLATDYYRAYRADYANLTAAGAVTRYANYVPNGGAVSAYNHNCPIANFPTIIKGRLYTSTNYAGENKINYEVKYGLAVQGKQELTEFTGTFSQSFPNGIAALSVEPAPGITLAKGTRLILFNPLKGIRGPRGEMGPTGQLTVGTVESGHVASANITGNAPNQILNLVLPKGPAGGDISLDLIYPVGSIYMSTNNVNPTTFFSGMWEAWGTGRVPVGVDVNQTEFNQPEKPGGNKFMQLHNHPQGGTAVSNGAHTHTVPNKQVPNNSGTSPVFESWPGNGTGGRTHTTSSAGAHTHTLSGNTGNAGSGDANNLQPYITCYMWKRVS